MRAFPSTSLVKHLILLLPSLSTFSSALNTTYPLSNSSLTATGSLSSSVNSTAASQPYSQADSCNAASISYSSSTLAAVTQQLPAWGTNTTTSSYGTSYTVSITTLCDGKPRAVGNISIVSSGYLPDVGWSQTYTPAPPDCTINQSNCFRLLSTYDSLLFAPDATTVPKYPACSDTGTYSSTITSSSSAPRPTQGSPSCGRCTINGGRVQLLYFPVTGNYSRDMCATAPGTTVTCPFGTLAAATTNTDPRFTTISGYVPQADRSCSYFPYNATTSADYGPYALLNNSTTLYQNMAYISYDSAYAANGCGYIGSTYAGGIVPVASTDVYSISGYHGGMNDKVGYPFHFADLNAPVPASAYNAMPLCFDSGNVLTWFDSDDKLNGNYGGRLGFCQTIFDDYYAPFIAVPPQYRAIDPAWHDCDLSLDGIWDPPKALTAVATEDAPSMPGNSATPSQTTSVAPQTSKTTSEVKTTPTAEPDLQTDTSTSGSGEQTTRQSASPGTSSVSEAQPTQTSDSNDASTGANSSAQDSTAGDSTPDASPTTSDETPVTEQAPSSGQTVQQSPSPAISQATTADPSGAGQAQDPSQSATTQAAGIGNLASAIGQIASSNTAVADPSGAGQTASSNTVASAATTGLFGTTQVIGDIIAGALGLTSSDDIGGAQQTGSGQAAAPQSADTNAAGTMVASVNGAAFTIAHTSAEGQESVVVVAGESGAATLAPGQTTVLQGQTVVAPTSGGVVIGASGAATTVLPTASSDPAAVTVDAVNGAAFTIAHTSVEGQESAVVVAGPSGTATLAPGQTTLIGGQDVSVDSSGGVAVAGSSVAFTPAAAADPQATQGAIVTADNGDEITVLPAGSSAAVVEAGGSTVTVAAGESTVLQGQTVVAPTSGGVVIGTGSDAKTVLPTASSDPANVAPGSGDSAAGTSVISFNSDRFTVAAASGSGGPSAMIVEVGGSTATLTPGVVTTIHGQQVSADASGVVIGTGNAASSVTLPAIPTESNGSTASLSDPSVVTLGNDAVSFAMVTQGSDPSAVEIVADGSTTVLTRGQSMTMDGQIVSVPSSGGIVVGTGSDAETVSLRQGNDQATAVTASHASSSATTTGPLSSSNTSTTTTSGTSRQIQSGIRLALSICSVLLIALII